MVVFNHNLVLQFEANLDSETEPGSRVLRHCDL